MEELLSSNAHQSLQANGPRDRFQLSGEQMEGMVRVGRKKFKQASESRVNRVTAKAIYGLIESQEFKCALTGVELTPDVTALDHIIPLSRGGDHSIENAQAVYAKVNRAKGTMTNDEFIAMCRQVVAYCGT